jgi:hypothetical protein
LKDIEGIPTRFRPFGETYSDGPMVICLTENDPQKCAVIERLLAEERRKLVALKKQSDKRQG